MPEETETLVKRHEYEEYRNTKNELTVYQRMLLMDGFVIMNTVSYTHLDVYKRQPYNSLGAALTTFTGQNIGAGKVDRVKQGHRCV